jgi:hypothetical protein
VRALVRAYRKHDRKPRLLARDAQTGEPVGGGSCTSPHRGATELTSANGNDLVFLMAAGEAEARIYGRAGFEAIGYFLHISRG